MQNILSYKIIHRIFAINYECRIIMVEKLQTEKELAQMARFAKALGHPIRLIILQHLEKQSCCYTGDFVEILPIAQSTVSQHIKELKDAGLIQGEINPPKVKYCINQDNWDKAKALFCDFFDTDFTNSSCSI